MFYWAVWVNPDGNRYVSYLYGNPDNRNFNLDDAGCEWGGSVWFFGLS